MYLEVTLSMYLEIVNFFTHFEANAQEFMEAADQRVERRKGDHFMAICVHPLLKHGRLDLGQDSSATPNHQCKRRGERRREGEGRGGREGEGGEGGGGGGRGRRRRRRGRREGERRGRRRRREGEEREGEGGGRGRKGKEKEEGGGEKGKEKEGGGGEGMVRNTHLHKSTKLMNM